MTDTTQPRISDGTFTTKPHTAPEVSLAAAGPADNEPSYSATSRELSRADQLLRQAENSAAQWNRALPGTRTGDLLVNRAKTALLLARVKHLVALTNLIPKRLAEAKDFLDRGYDEYNQPHSADSAEDARLSIMKWELDRDVTAGRLEQARAAQFEWDAGRDARVADGVE